MTEDNVKNNDTLMLWAVLLIIAYPITQIISVMVVAIFVGVLGAGFSTFSITSYGILLADGLLLWAVFKECGSSGFSRIGLVKESMSIGKIVLLIVLTYIIVSVLGYAYDELLQTDGQPDIEKLILTAKENGFSLDSIFLIFSITVFGPLIEEIIFRGYLQSALMKKTGPFLAIFLSSLVFGAVHFDLDSLPVLTMMGFAFGYIYYKTGSIIPSMILHMLNNSLSVGMLILAPELYSDRYAFLFNWL